MDDLFFDTPLPVDTHRTACTTLGASTARRLESTMTLLPTMHLARILTPTTHFGQLDIGANYSVTAHRSLLTNYRPFPQPVPMDSIDASGTPLRCLGSGLYQQVTESHGQPFAIPMWYCPGVSETLIAPDHVCRESPHYTVVDSHHDVATDVGHLRFSSKSGLSTLQLSLTRANGLWYIARIVPGTESLDAPIAGTLGALAAHIHEGDAIADVPPDPAPVLHAMRPPTMSELWCKRPGPCRPLA
jgi:hypothetical protein